MLEQLHISPYHLLAPLANSASLLLVPTCLERISLGGAHQECGPLTCGSMNQFAVSIDIRDDHLQCSHALRESTSTQVDGHERRFWIGNSIRFSVPLYLAKNHPSIYFG